MMKRWFTAGIPRYFFLMLALMLLGLVSVVAAAPPAPYFPNRDYSESNYYWPNRRDIRS